MLVSYCRPVPPEPPPVDPDPRPLRRGLREHLRGIHHREHGDYTIELSTNICKDLQCPEKVWLAKSAFIHNTQKNTHLIENRMT